MTHRTVSAALAIALTLSGLAAVSVATPEPASARAASPKHYRLAKGVSVWHDKYRVTTKRTVGLSLMHVEFSAKGPRLDADTPGHVVGKKRQTLSTMLDANRAVGAINADFFNWRTGGTVPAGGVIRSGHVLKTPRPTREANFYVRKDGRAAIGPLTYTASVTRAAVGARTEVTRRIASTNTVFDALAGRITLINSSFIVPALPKGCVVAAGTVKGSKRIVSAVVSGVRHLAQRTGSNWALLSCSTSDGPQGAAWLKDKLRVGDAVHVAAAISGGTPRMAVGGGSVLVHRGSAYVDHSPRVTGTHTNPETFACVSANGRRILLGTVDGRIKQSAGVTFAELTRYMLRISCYSGIVFDGGGSTTMVARYPGHRSPSIVNHPSEGRQRPLPDGLFVYSH